MSNVVYLSTHPRFPVSQPKPDFLERSLRAEGHADVLKLLRDEAGSLMDEAFRSRALGQESAGKLKEEHAKYLLSLVASLPAKLRAQ